MHWASGIALPNWPETVAQLCLSSLIRDFANSSLAGSHQSHCIRTPWCFLQPGEAQRIWLEAMKFHAVLLTVQIDHLCGLPAPFCLKRGPATHETRKHCNSKLSDTYFKSSSRTLHTVIRCADELW